MGIETGDSISFILTIFSIILSIIPNIVPKTDDTPTTNLPLFQANIDIQDNSINYDLFAKKILHKPMSDKNFVAEDYINNYNIFDDTEKARILYHDLSDAVDIYNDKSIDTNSFNQTIKNLNDTFSDYCSNKVKTYNVCKEIWFTVRLLVLESDHRHNTSEDSVHCKDISNKTYKCSYRELQELKNINSQMEKGFVDYFYNDRNVTSLEKPIESFVSGLNNFFMASLLTGPSIFLAYIQRKSKNK
jgi:hypothetical protein